MSFIRADDMLMQLRQSRSDSSREAVTTNPTANDLLFVDDCAVDPKFVKRRSETTR